MKHLFIINPAAGKRENTRRLEADIRGLEWDWEIAYTAKSGDACRYARAAAEAGVEVLVRDCRVTPGELWLDAPVPADLGPV